MRIKQFEYMLEIARHGSIKQAAEKLYISPQALSEMLKGIEEKLGFLLFERTNKGVTPTINGKIVLQDMSDMVSKYYGWEKYREERQLNIILQYNIGDVLLDKTFTDILKNFPHIHVQFNTASPDVIFEQIVTIQSSIAVLCIEKNTKNYRDLQKVIKSGRYRVEKIMSEDLAAMKVLMRTNECQGDSEIITIDDIAGKVLMANKDLLAIEPMKKIKDDGRVSFEELPISIRAVAQIANNKNIVTFLPHFIAKNNIYVRNGLLTFRQLQESQDEEWHCFLLYHESMTLAFQSVINEIKKYFLRK